MTDGRQETTSSLQPIKPMKRAVALRYAPEQFGAPVVMAKGNGHVAEAIAAKALEHGVPLQKDASLVEVLSKLDLQQAIPPELYELVAELLSYLYRTDSRMRDQYGEGGGL